MAVLLHWPVLSQLDFHYRDVTSSFNTSILFVSDLSVNDTFVSVLFILPSLQLRCFKSLNLLVKAPDDTLHDEGSCEYEEESGEVEGESGGEVFEKTVVGEEYEAQMEEQIETDPTTPDNNEYCLLSEK